MILLQQAIQRVILKLQIKNINSKYMSLKWVLEICTLVILSSLTSAISSVELTLNNQTILVFNNSIYSPKFISSHSTYSCTLNNLYTYKQSPQNLQNNTPYHLSITGINQSTKITISTQYGIVSPTLSVSSCSANCTVQIKNFCPNPVGLFKYFDTILLNIQGLQTLTYNVLCDDTFGTSTFQAGQFLIVICCFLIIISTAIYNRAWAFQVNGIQITYVYIIFYAIAEAIGGTLIVVDPQVAQIVGDVIIWLIGGFGIIIIFNEILYKFRIQILNKTLLNLKKYRIRIMEIVSSFIALGFLLSWILSDKNWVLSTFISICTIIATIKIFKITSFKKAIILYLVEITIEVTFVILIDVLQKTSYQQFLLNDFNNPLQIQVPTINPVYGLKCSWLPISVTIFPGILLSYFHRFDNSRNTKIYLITSSVAFFFGAMIWIIITSLSTVNLPFQSITEPAMLILVILFAYNRKEIKVLWNGKFYDPEFKNQQDHEEEAYNYELETKKPDINQNFLQGLRISKEDQSQIESNQNSQRQRNIRQQQKMIQNFKSKDLSDNI